MFVCYYCEKDIQGITIVVDDQHLAHVECGKKNKEIESGQKSGQDVQIDFVSRHISRHDVAKSVAIEE